MTASRPTLGCIISSYGRPRAVQRAVRSALLSPGFSEVIVVDDASPVPVDLSDIATPRLAILRHDVNRGVCAARNTGLAASHSSHLVFLDDDDALLPWAGWFYRRWITRAAQADLNRIVVGALLVEAPGRKSHMRRPPSSRPGEIWGLDRHIEAGGRSVNTKQAAAIPRRLIEEAGGWDEALRSRSSSEMFYRLTERAAVDGHPVPVYRLNRASHDKLTGDPARRAESHDYIRRKHAGLLRHPERRAAFEATHDAMMARAEGGGAR